MFSGGMMTHLTLPSLALFRVASTWSATLVLLPKLLQKEERPTSKTSVLGLPLQINSIETPVVRRLFHKNQQVCPHMTMVQNQWYYFGIGAPPILESDVRWGVRAWDFEPWPYLALARSSAPMNSSPSWTGSCRGACDGSFRSPWEACH